MSTRCAIVIENSDHSYDAIYCHSDGYPGGPAGMGRKLLGHYSTEAAVRELLAGGDLSCLRESPETSEYFARDLGKPFERYAPGHFQSFRSVIEGYSVLYWYVFRPAYHEWSYTYLFGQTLTPDSI